VFMRVPNIGPAAPSRNVEVEQLPVDIDTQMYAESNKDLQEYQDNIDRLGLLPSGTPENDKLRAGYREAADLAQKEQKQYHALCGCVYAAVIQAMPAVLGALADRPEVRAVDVVPPESDRDPAVFTPPIPEQSGPATLPPH